MSSLDHLFGREVARVLVHDLHAERRALVGPLVLHRAAERVEALDHLLIEMTLYIRIWSLNNDRVSTTVGSPSERGGRSCG